jgi:hypothetical protein
VVGPGGDQPDAAPDLTSENRIGPAGPDGALTSSIRRGPAVSVDCPHSARGAVRKLLVPVAQVPTTTEHAPAWWTLADAEGNEADVATWMSRE